MDYNRNISELIDAIKADKSILQPWRNKAVARVEEAQAFVRMGLTSTSKTTADQASENICICPIGATRTDCPMINNHQR
jgi:hypothetical protein